jgi:hypothetical protein
VFVTARHFWVGLGVAFRRSLGRTWIVAVTAAIVAGCHADPPDRRADVDALARQIGAMPGVRSAHSDSADSLAQGRVYFTVHVEVADDVTADQMAAIAGGYLQGLRAVDYRGYDAALDLRRGGNVFAVDSGKLPITNDDQILAQARDWIALRQRFPDATIVVRATVTHPSGRLPIQEMGYSNLGSIDLPLDDDYRQVTAAVTTLSTGFAELSGIAWTISAGKRHPATIATWRRLPSTDELQVWDVINADQTIPHTDLMTINGPVKAPVWLAEKTTQSHDATVALQLARQHLPIVATLPRPVLYTASDQMHGHIGGDGQSLGPIAVTVGGCTKRDLAVYRPGPEFALINQYETCHHT